MFGMSIDPRVRAALGIIVLAIGVAVRQPLLDAAGGVLVLWAGARWLRRTRDAR